MQIEVEQILCFGAKQKGPGVKVPKSKKPKTEQTGCLDPR